ncbi:hypothetical protein Fmac_011497 [Flemingia macrophylla]|uniref:Uncharacterized protein n=1 Tax=Flemingia macrophylla TaxID=520843 RepID=A0ABD1MMZ2_9FABA
MGVEKTHFFICLISPLVTKLQSKSSSTQIGKRRIELNLQSIKYFPTMKGFLIAFLLLASVFFLPSSTLARQLYETEAVDATPVARRTGDPSKSAIKCDPGKPYGECQKPIKAPKRQCPGYKQSC